jgi:phosphoglycerol transferase MdoB-like AlkP superfamily enzyme
MMGKDQFLRLAAAYRWGPAALLAALLVLLSTVIRLVLLFHPATGTVGIFDGVVVFLVGGAFDVVVASFYCAAFLIITTIAPNAVARSLIWRALMLLFWGALAYALMLIAVSEWLFWDEFGGRFNFIAVDYLLYTHEVWRNIRESYAVGAVLGVLVVPVAAVMFFLRQALWNGVAAATSWRQKLASLAGCVLTVTALAYLADSDYREVSTSDAATELAGNGIFQFFAANRRNELPFNKHYAAIDPARALGLVRSALEKSQQPPTKMFGEGVERWVPAQTAPDRRPNIVLISIESMGAEFLGSYGNPHGLTPTLDRLARESLWFSNVFATGNRTVRGLEALTLALPPTPGQSIVRRPKNEELFSLGSVLEDNDYEVYYAYGGFGYFDNMNAFFGANDYHIIDRTDIPRDRIHFANAWGVADEILFDQMLEVLDREHRQRGRKTPFFTHIMTVSNHRPYTYPSGRIDIPSGTGRDGAVKYTDYAVGKFLRDAEKRSWFANTIFVVTADHGANARGTMEIPVEKYRIPLFFYAPGRIAPRKVERLMSQIDIAPTLLGFTGLSYYSKFFGRDVLHAPRESDRAFVANYQTLGYMRDGKLVTLQPKRKVRVSRVDADGNFVFPLKDPALAEEAIAFYQVASFLFRSGLYRDEEQIPPEKRAKGRMEPGKPR